MNVIERNNWHNTEEYSTLESIMKKLSAFDLDGGYWTDREELVKHKEALILIREFFDYYEKCSLSKKIRIYEGYEFHYYSFLPRARIFHLQLMKNNLTAAVHELCDLLNYYPGLQTRVHSAIITSWKMYKEKYSSEFDVML